MKEEAPQDVADVNVLRAILEQSASNSPIVRHGDRLTNEIFDGLWPGMYELVLETASTTLSRSVELPVNATTVRVTVSPEEWGKS